MTGSEISLLTENSRYLQAYLMAYVGVPTGAVCKFVWPRGSALYEKDPLQGMKNPRFQLHPVSIIAGNFYFHYFNFYSD